MDETDRDGGNACADHVGLCSRKKLDAAAVDVFSQRKQRRPM